MSGVQGQLAPDVIGFRFGNSDVEVISGQVEITTGSTRLALALGVPKHVYISEFCAFIEPFTSGAIHLQIVEPDTAYDGDYYYGVLVVLPSAAACEEFCDRLHDRPFNSVEDDRCQMLRVAETDAPRLPDRALLDASPECCPVCLEVIGSSASVSILCRHRFHFHCLRNWKGNSAACPVCRHHMQPKNQPHCERCLLQNKVLNSSNLWICLVCGHVGCGRNHESHALEHFHESCHTFALDITSRSVWDYAADNFVHRLIMGDGKLVEVEASTGDDEVDESNFKLEEILDEYNVLLSSQLQEQCALFKKQQKQQSEKFERDQHRIECEIDSVLESQISIKERISALEATIRTNELQLKELQTAEDQCASELKSLQRLHEKLQAGHSSTKKQIESEKPNPSKTVLELDSEIHQLQETLKDLQFYVESQRTVQKSPLKEEIHSGSLVVLEGPKSGKKSRRKKR